jgi:DNA-binding MarR family transcriptional regulator
MKNLLSEKEILNIWVLLGWTRDTLRRVRQKELSPYGISPDQAAVLQLVHNFGGTATTTEVSPYLLRERHSVHELLARMERAGLLKKVNNPDRKHGVKVVLTDRGRQAYRHVKKREIFGRILAILSEEDREQLRSYLMTLLKAARKEIGEVEEVSVTEIYGLRQLRQRRPRLSRKASG